ATAFAQSASDQGGGDVRVSLFTTHVVREVVLSSAGANAWTAKCERCAHVPLTGDVRVSAPAELFAGGRLRVRDVASGEERRAAGLWHLRARDAASGFDVVLTLPSERYVEAVVSAESGAADPAESLRAMAVLARTYALNGAHYKPGAGHLPAELCDSTQCQALRLGNVSSAVSEAVWATAGETLWFGQRRAEVFYSQDCGGMTESASAVWPTLRGASYLSAHADPYCVRRDPARWHAEVPLSELARIARSEGWKLPQQIVAVRVSERSQSKRALRVVFRGADGTQDAVAASALRFGIGRALGWNRVRSDGYDVLLRGDALVFDGRGFGHGVGPCQAGAEEMAREGRSAREILAFYFPGTALRITPRDAGWVESVTGGVRVRSVETLSAARKDAIAKTWVDAKRRFAPSAMVSPEVVLAPTTELFRQMSGQPGWMLGSTRGGEIVLQPASVLRANGQEEQSVMLHEMLHALVEAEAGAPAPLWLREGLVEVLAGEKDGPEASLPESTMERALRDPASLEEARRAHQAAGQRVSRLVARYGLGTVRGWLRSGVPIGVGEK